MHVTSQNNNNNIQDHEDDISLLINWSADHDDSTFICETESK
jgi:hypothetical protein